MNSSWLKPSPLFWIIWKKSNLATRPSQPNSGHPRGFASATTRRVCGSLTTAVHPQSGSAEEQEVSKFAAEDFPVLLAVSFLMKHNNV